jgi:hypothetical protein
MAPVDCIAERCETIIAGIEKAKRDAVRSRDTLLPMPEKKRFQPGMCGTVKTV